MSNKDLFKTKLFKIIGVDKNDGLNGYRKLDRHEVSTIPVGSLLKYRDGNGDLHYGGKVLEVLYPRAVVNTIIKLHKFRPYNFKYLSASEVYIKEPNEQGDKKTKSSDIKKILGNDIMNAAYERVRLKILAPNNNSKNGNKD